jgi:hypothetical protein
VPLFRKKKKKPEPASEEHGVITYLPFASGDEFGTEDEREAVFALEERIEAAVARVGGEHDGNEFGEGQAILYTCGPDADAVFVALREALQGFPLQPGSRAVKRYGPPQDDSRSETVELA